MDQYLLALDAGTGSIRAVLFDTNGNQIYCAQREWTHEEDPRWPGSMDFDWIKNWQLTCECTNELMKNSKVKPKAIKAISTTCMREGIILYDDKGNEQWACANVDSRSTNEVADLVKFHPDLEKKVYEISGQSFALNAIPRLLWIKNNMPEIYNSTSKLGMFNDWLAYKLTGRLAVEPSNGSTTGLMNLKTRNWDLDLAEMCGIRTDIFPEVLENGEKLGQVMEKASDETGLPVGLPVIIGGGDCQLGSLGVGVTKPGDVAVFGGSFWQYEVVSDHAVTDKGCRVRLNCHALPRLWQYEALAFKPGMVMRWFRDSFCQKEIEDAKSLGVDPYNLLNEKAKEVPVGSYGMSCCFSDIMNFTSWKHASPTFINFALDPDKYNKYTFYRAILENTAYLVKGHIQLVKDISGFEPDSLTFAGGAAKSPLWAQILADVTNKKVRVPKVKEATALGAALLAGVGVGVYDSIEDAVKDTIQWETEYLPNPKNHEIYQEEYSKWREIYKHILELSDEGVTDYMWSAPGISE